MKRSQPAKKQRCSAQIPLTHTSEWFSQSFGEESVGAPDVFHHHHVLALRHVARLHHLKSARVFCAHLSGSFKGTPGGTRNTTPFFLGGGPAKNGGSHFWVFASYANMEPHKGGSWLGTFLPLTGIGLDRWVPSQRGEGCLC